MPLFDASSMLSAWDHYPLDQFPGLWIWMGVQVKRHEIRLPAPALGEVGHKADDCVEWLEGNGHSVLKLSNPILEGAFRLKNMLGIADDRYDPDGVDENDLLIVSSAVVAKQELVSDEARQLTLPRNLRKYKIPAVCGLSQVRISHLNVLEFIKRSRVVFR